MKAKHVYNIKDLEIIKRNVSHRIKEIYNKSVIEREEMFDELIEIVCNTYSKESLINLYFDLSKKEIGYSKSKKVIAEEIIFYIGNIYVF